MQRVEKLTAKEQKDLISDLIEAFTILKSREEIAFFMVDLLTRGELKILSKRLRIAKLISRGESFEDVCSDLHASKGTVAKVGLWLREKGLGIRKVLEQLPKSENRKPKDSSTSWTSLRKRYPQYFVLDEIFESVFEGEISPKNEALAEKAMADLNEKAHLHREVDEEILETERNK